MIYFLDTEFIEGTQQQSIWEQYLFNFPPRPNKPTIDLISIGIVSEDGAEYYAVSKDFNLKEAWNRFEWKRRTIDVGIAGAIKEFWLRDNVLTPIWKDLMVKDGATWDEICEIPIGMSYRWLKHLIKKYGKSNKQIAEEIIRFIYPDAKYNHPDCKPNQIGDTKSENPVFYGDFVAYDWVVFCWLFGKMNDLPKGFPYYCRDLQQIKDEIIIQQSKVLSNKIKNTPKQEFKIEQLAGYPKQSNEHNALADAKWNRALYLFLTKNFKQSKITL